MDFRKLFTSSADPNRTSLAVKGFLVSLAPLAMLVFGFTEAEFGTLVESIVNIVFWGLSIVSAVQVILGLRRKVRLGRWSA